jgi:hypothetical protein
MGRALLSMWCQSRIHWLPLSKAGLISGKIADMVVPNARPRRIGFHSSFASFQGEFFDLMPSPIFRASPLS